MIVGLAIGMQAQYPEDALRLSTPGLGVGARALGMGNAFTGVASDFSAIYWNPAGLAQLPLSEFSAGLSYLSNTDNSLFFGTKEAYTNSAMSLNSLGLVHKVPTARGNLALAFGFQRGANFTTGMSFTGYNPNSSIIQTYARDGASYPSDISGNIAYQLYLADIDTVNGTFVSPISNRVTQLAQVLEGGGLNNWSIAGAVDVAKELSLGVTLTYLSGTYRYDRKYEEKDLAGVYNAFPYDLEKFTLDEFIESDISGVNGKFGLLYRVPDRFRFGIAVKTPTAFTIKESFGSFARAYFDNGDVRPSDEAFETTASTEYDVRTPWVVSAGASLILQDLMLSGDVESTDWTQMEFANANADVVSQNTDFKTIFRPTINFRGGLEYDLQQIGVRLRGGFIYNRSPYQDDPSEYDQKYVTGGLGIQLSPTAMLDLTYAHGWWESFRYNYNSTSRTDEKISANTFLMTFSHRF
jgi:long-subunit fatty acid transport protein